MQQHISWTYAAAYQTSPSRPLLNMVIYSCLHEHTVTPLPGILWLSPQQMTIRCVLQIHHILGTNETGQL